MQLLNIVLLIFAALCFFLAGIKRPESNVVYGWLGAFLVTFDLLAMAIAAYK
jgi:hypothetical protein